MWIVLKNIDKSKSFNISKSQSTIQICKNEMMKKGLV